MRNIKLTIEYDGTSYCGWQKQINGPSIQETLEKALAKITGQKVTLTGAGRTDSGVHALAQVASFKVKSRLATEQLLFALNTNLPKDIAVKKVEAVRPGFNARFRAKSRLYRYSIINSPVRSPLEIRHSYQFRIPLDIKLMRREAKTLLGRHNFSSFQAKGGSKTTPVTTVKKISVTTKGKHIYIDIEAKGFLYNMVRNIVGTLMDIGRGKLSPGDTRKILKAKNRTLAGPTAPAKGLCLMKVNY